MTEEFPAVKECTECGDAPKVVLGDYSLVICNECERSAKFFSFPRAIAMWDRMNTRE